MMSLWSGVLVAVLASGCGLQGKVAGRSSATTTSSGAMPATATPATATPATATATAAEPGDTSGKATMPDLTGLSEPAARDALRAAGIVGELEVNRRPLDCEGARKQVGRIDCQLPEPGRVVARGALISINIHEAHRIAGALVRAQLEQALGLTLDDARAHLKRIGHDGRVRIFEQHTFSNACGVGKVCGVEPSSGTGVHDDITLVINPGSNVEITVPD